MVFAIFVSFDESVYPNNGDDASSQTILMGWVGAKLMALPDDSYRRPCRVSAFSIMENQYANVGIHEAVWAPPLLVHAMP